MRSIPRPMETSRSLRVCSYEDRPEAMDGLILMGESLCRVNPGVSLHLTVPDAPASVRTWAGRRPEVELCTSPPDGVTGWDVKPLLLLQQLNAGRNEAIWLDSDTIVTRPISSLLEEFPRGSLIVSEEWDRHEPIPITHLWGMSSVRPVWPTNSSFVRATLAHRPLLERWLQMAHDPRYREAQSLPFAQRPFHLASDQVLLNALLESEEFGQVSFDYLRLGRHIAQCAGSSGYRPAHRLLDLFRGLPPLIHCIGRKPWQSSPDGGRIGRFLTDLATDVSPYVLASRNVAKALDLQPSWLDARTSMGAMLRGLTACHPGMAGLPLATLHAFVQNVSLAIQSRKPPVSDVPVLSPAISSERNP
jgi:hypothetical protein